MSDLLISFITYAESLPWLELVAMLLALAYVLLAAAGSIWCWPAALISTAIYTYVFYDVLLLMDSALSIYYLVMAVYGYWAWQQRTPTKNEQSSPPLDIVSWQFSFHVKACLVLTFIALALGYIMANYTPADFPYLDTFTTVFAVFATYLVAQKVLENWLYWIAIDAASIYLYIEKDLTPTAVLFILYTFIATWGYFKWRSLYLGNRIAIKHRVNS
ncbi:nicotinamide riboside transporter PnuC [Colwellia sp. 4_MG-2023]|uniref:nicotinamide riboside transporter PnuC n=1 Tax=unclassified Colwellia TaxID=196834 RepID=UPI0026E2C8E5|nr:MULTISPECIES: nicotinamide riboside transporter PnuC [unclassified Colwellia]MDO6505799.1 nicotinamide riboside transporter PnuC [Colwellia sp. 5_MG-2023]MDO6554480.1 nicotinamide riboside transporter PnuC [Colwellia sp. 4_MG-2023]